MCFPITRITLHKHEQFSFISRRSGFGDFVQFVLVSMNGDLGDYLVAGIYFVEFMCPKEGRKHVNELMLMPKTQRVQELPVGPQAFHCAKVISTATDMTSSSTVEETELIKVKTVGIRVFHYQSIDFYFRDVSGCFAQSKRKPTHLFGACMI